MKLIPVSVSSVPPGVPPLARGSPPATSGVNKHGEQFALPVQAKGGNDRLSVVQTAQDLACCREKFSGLTCRPISAQFMSDEVIAMFELALDGKDVRIIEEKHYRLVPSDQIGADDLRSRSGVVSSLEEAFRLLDRYPYWPSLEPLEVHPDLRLEIFREVNRKGGIAEEKRWSARLRCR